MTTRKLSLGSYKSSLVAALAVALLGLLLGVADSDEPQDRLHRKVKVMERVLDEVLVQSENVTVGMTRSSRGLVLDDYGVVFSIDASLGVGLFSGRHFMVGELEEVAELEALVQEEREGERGERSARRVELKKMQEEQEEKRRQHLQGFRQELTDALIDYGITLGELDDGQWVIIAIFFDGLSRPFGGGDSERLVLKVKMGQLRKHAAGTISRQAISNAVIVEQS